MGYWPKSEGWVSPRTLVLDSEIVLIVLFLLALVLWIIAIPIYLMVSARGLRRQVKALEARLEIALARLEGVPVRQASAASEDVAPEQSTPETVSEPLAGTSGDSPVELPQQALETSQTPVPEPPVAEKPLEQNYVFTSDNRNRLTEWLAQNWVSAIAVLSLTFAGIFFVRYGIEHGLLPP